MSSRIIIFLFFIFLSSFFIPHSFAQSSTLEINNEKSPVGKNDLPPLQYNRVMVIPFEEKMYMSQIDKEISEKTGKTQNEIREIFRKAICNNVFIETKMAHDRFYSAVSMHSEDPEIIADLNYIYQSIGYKYLPVPSPHDTAKPTAVSSLKKATDKAQEIFDEKKEGESGTKIQEGQIVSHPDNREKYMSVAVVNREMLSTLSLKYECEYFIFINQLDLVVPPGTDYRELSSDEYPRLMKTHFTILDKNGNEIYGNAVKSYFSSRENDAQKIANSQFENVAKQIISKLPDPNQSKNSEEKKKEEQKKAKKQQSSFDDY